MPLPEQISYVTPIEGLNNGTELVRHLRRNREVSIVMTTVSGSRKHGAQVDIKVLVQAVRYIVGTAGKAAYVKGAVQECS